MVEQKQIELAVESVTDSEYRDDQGHFVKGYGGGPGRVP